MKPVIVEKDGVKVAVAVQVNVKQCNHRDAGSHQLPSQSSEAGPGWLESVCGAIGAAADGFIAAVRIVVLGAGRALLLGVNVLGLLGAVLARAYLLGWASVGGTHRQLSRRISPWLPTRKETVDDLPALYAQALEAPKGYEHAPRPLLRAVGHAMAISVDADNTPPRLLEKGRRS